MIGNMAVYTALTEPGDVIAQPFGGHSSNRFDGPAGVRGLKIVDIQFDPVELAVDLDLFRKVAPLVRPRVVALGASMTLFPFPIQAIRDIVNEWGGHVYFDGAHQLGLIAGGQFQDPLPKTYLCKRATPPRLGRDQAGPYASPSLRSLECRRKNLKRTRQG